MTITETLITASIILVLFGGITGYLFSTQTNSSRIGNIIDLKQQLQLALQIITDDLYQASGTRCTIIDENEMFFQIPTVCTTANGCSDNTGAVLLKNGDINWGDGETTYNFLKYAILNGHLERSMWDRTKTNKLNFKVFGTDFSEIKFVRTDNANVRIDIELIAIRDFNGTPITEKLVTSVTPRNN
ncbi:MAG: hypothetical protein PHC58_06110 [Candidatus Omnitrophica bacterium]|nr:hypothetical protein [Candidatus Omnitrophota bacterium]